MLVARILRPRGNKGEIIAELLTDFPARFANLKQIYLGKENQPPRLTGLQRFWMDRNHPGMGVFHFAGFTSISEAEKLRGCDVLLPFEERVLLPAGKYFVSDLIGCAVFDSPVGSTKLSSPPCSAEQTPRVLGTVRDVFFTGETVAGTPILQVRHCSRGIAGSTRGRYLPADQCGGTKNRCPATRRAKRRKAPPE